MCRSLKITLLFTVLLSVMLAACAPAATPVPTAPQIVEVTKMVEVTKVVEKSATATPFPTARPPFKQFPLPTPSIREQVEVNGNKMWLECYGQGSPTVVLEHGYGGNSTNWHSIIPQLAAETQVCAYDRINTGHSTVTTDSRTMAQASEELDALLKVAKIGGPYILAGHSFGGFFVLTYASGHPEQVVGAVLVDSTYLDDCKNTLQLLPVPSPNDVRIFSDIREECKKLETLKPEGLIDHKESVRAVKSLGDIPLVVIARGSLSKIGQEWYPGVTAELVAKLEQPWQDAQKEYAKLSTDSTYILAENSGHFIQDDEPQLVIDAILKLVDKAR